MSSSKKNIRNRSKKSKKRHSKSKLIVYGGTKSKLISYGEIVDIDEKLNGKAFARKLTFRKVELDITEILRDNPNPNVVTIYNVNREKSTIDMELLNMDYVLTEENKEKIDKMIKNVIVYLHSLHIMYIDWKYDNIGMDSNGNFKLFDFDSSGIANDSNTEWEKAPGSSYVQALLSFNHITSPLCSDNFLCFLFINGMLEGNDHNNIYE